METQIESICWDCANAYGQCAWSRKFEKVEGWVAVKTVIQQNEGDTTDSYCVLWCPKFRKEKRK